MTEEEDFTARCILLSSEFKMMAHREPSSRVWISVMATLIKELILNQEDSKKSFEQLRDYLDPKAEEKSVSPGAENG